jgi:hypothetical protein
VIVSDNLARELWGTPAAALGKRLRTIPTTPWREVIGVVQDVRDNGAHAPAPTIVYWPALIHSLYVPGAPVGKRDVTFAIRSNAAGTEGLLSQMRQAVWTVNGNLPLASVRTMQEIYDQSLARTSFTLVMLAIAGAMALVLGVIGIYGVIAYSVSQRTREIGIRLALGATRARVVGHVLGGAARLMVVGVGLGLGGGVLAVRLLRAQVAGVDGANPALFLALPLALIVIALGASWVPARRAARVPPTIALREE